MIIEIKILANNNLEIPTSLNLLALVYVCLTCDPPEWSPKGTVLDHYQTD